MDALNSNIGVSNSEKDWKEIESLYRLGQLTVREIGEQFGVVASTVVRRAAKNGWPREPRTMARRAPATKKPPAEMVAKQKERLARLLNVHAALIDELESTTMKHTMIERFEICKTAVEVETMLVTLEHRIFASSL